MSKQISKLLSLVLRHRPEAIGVTLDSHGWVEMGVLQEALQANGYTITNDEIHQVVRNCEKQRFTIRDGRIRANQGHSLGVDLDYQPRDPPTVLFHGTAERFLVSIQVEGIRKMSRLHVHLSSDLETARKVGMRHGRPAILLVDSETMAKDGLKFFLSENGVWLTEEVPVKYIGFP